jgi:hypothetical protein
MSLERRAAVTGAAQQLRARMPVEGYELPTPFLHGGRYFLQALGESNSRIQAERRTFQCAFPVRNAARSRSRSTSESCVERSKKPGRFRAGMAHGSVHGIGLESERGTNLHSINDRNEMRASVTTR